MPILRQRKASSYTREKDGRKIKVTPQNFDLEISKAIAASCGWGKGDELVVVPDTAGGTARIIKV